MLIERGARGRRKYHHTSRRYRELSRLRLRGWAAAGAFAACFVPVFLGFLLPGGQLLVWTVETAGTVVDARFLGLAANSVLLALAAAALAVAV